MRWYPQTRFYKTKLMYDIDTFLTHYIPALLSDVVDKLKGDNGRFGDSKLFNINEFYIFF